MRWTAVLLPGFEWRERDFDRDLEREEEERDAGWWTFSSIEGREAVVEAGEETGEFEASEEAEEGGHDPSDEWSVEMKAGGSGSLNRIVEAYPNGLRTSLKNAQPTTSAKAKNATGKKHRAARTLNRVGKT